MAALLYLGYSTLTLTLCECEVAPVCQRCVHQFGGIPLVLIGVLERGINHADGTLVAFKVKPWQYREKGSIKGMIIKQLSMRTEHEIGQLITDRFVHWGVHAQKQDYNLYSIKCTCNLNTLKCAFKRTITSYYIAGWRAIVQNCLRISVVESFPC